MAIAHGVHEGRSWLVRLGTTDFCPWANRFVYWLKEPIGWFVLATGVSCLIGLYFSPIGWSLAAALSVIMVIGMIWPWVAVRCVPMELVSDGLIVQEESDARMVVRVKNRLPFPIWGLVVEGYLDTRSDDLSRYGDPKLATVGLASVPPWCEADYSFTIHPLMRGLYPRQTPTITCSFPFGIWTARKSLNQFLPLMVWPKLYTMPASATFRGRLKTAAGEGRQSSCSGDFIGVRGYRRGDSPKHVNWVASAKMDSLIVTERGVAQTVAVRLRLDTSLSDLGDDELSRRVRIAASIFTSLWHQKIPVRVHIGDRCIHSNPSVESYRLIMEAFSEVPLDGLPGQPASISTQETEIVVTSAAEGTQVNIHQPSTPRCYSEAKQTWLVSLDDSLAVTMQRFWREVQYVGTSV